MEQQNVSASDVPDSPTPKLPDFTAFIKESIDRYKQVWKVLVKIQLVSWLAIFGLYLGVIIAAIVASLSRYPGGSLPVSATPEMTEIGLIFMIIGGVGAALLISWFSAAEVIVLRDQQEGLTLREAMRRARPYVLPYLWTSILAAAIFIGGLVLFVIPGLVFAVWFMFWPYALIVDNVRGFAALQKSRDYVRGNFLNVLLLSAVAMVASFFVNLVTRILNAVPLGGFATLILSVLIYPIYGVYFYLIFTHLRRLKTGDMSASIIATTPDKKLAFGLAVAGLVAILAIVAAGVYFAPQIRDQMTREIDRLNIQNPAQMPQIPQGSI
jgi:hypothetical protein